MYLCIAERRLGWVGLGYSIHCTQTYSQSTQERTVGLVDKLLEEGLGYKQVWTFIRFLIFFIHFLVRSLSNQYSYNILIAQLFDKAQRHWVEILRYTEMENLHTATQQTAAEFLNINLT